MSIICTNADNPFRIYKGTKLQAGCFSTTAISEVARLGSFKIKLINALLLSCVTKALILIMKALASACRVFGLLSSNTGLTTHQSSERCVADASHVTF